MGNNMFMICSNSSRRLNIFSSIGIAPINAHVFHSAESVDLDIRVPNCCSRKFDIFLWKSVLETAPDLQNQRSVTHYTPNGTRQTGTPGVVATVMGTMTEADGRQ